LERRRKRIAHDRTRSLDKQAPGKTPPMSLPNIAELIEYGQITVGVLRQVGAVAVASDGHNSLAMLVRRQGETLDALLVRLDRAIDKALNEEIFTDEINVPTPPSLLTCTYPPVFPETLKTTHLSTRPAPYAYPSSAGGQEWAPPI
jgi:hypothetical protein